MFSLPQRLKFYDPMVTQGWAAHCDRECITDSTAASKKAWEREELKKTFGVDTTKGLNKGKDFDRAMAHFEELAGDGIHWQMKLLNGDAVRARHQLTETIKAAAIAPAYTEAICEQMGIPTGLAALTAEQALNLRKALLYHLRRKQGARYQRKELA